MSYIAIAHHDDCEIVTQGTTIDVPVSGSGSFQRLARVCTCGGIKVDMPIFSRSDGTYEILFPPSSGVVD